MIIITWNQVIKYTFLFIGGCRNSAKLTASLQRGSGFMAPPLHFHLNQWDDSMSASRGPMPLRQFSCFKLWSANWIALFFLLCLHCSPSCGFPAWHNKQPQWIFSTEERLIYVKQLQSPSEAFKVSHMMNQAHIAVIWLICSLEKCTIITFIAS